MPALESEPARLSPALWVHGTGIVVTTGALADTGAALADLVARLEIDVGQ